MENFNQQNRIEQIKKKKEKREELKEFLPDDLALEYSQNIHPHKWNFEGNLVAKRHLENDVDTLFFKALEAHNENSLNEENKKELRVGKRQLRNRVAITLSVETELSDEFIENELIQKGRSLKNIVRIIKKSGIKCPEVIFENIDKYSEPRYSINYEYSSYLAILTLMKKEGIKFPNNAQEIVSKQLELLSKDGRKASYDTRSYPQYSDKSDYSETVINALEADIITDEQIDDYFNWCAYNQRWHDYATVLKKTKAAEKKLPENLEDHAEKSKNRYELAKNPFIWGTGRSPGRRIDAATALVEIDGADSEVIANEQVIAISKDAALGLGRKYYPSGIATFYDSLLDKWQEKGVDPSEEFSKIIENNWDKEDDFWSEKEPGSLEVELEELLLKKPFRRFKIGGVSDGEKVPELEEAGKEVKEMFTTSRSGPFEQDIKRQLSNIETSQRVIEVFRKARFQPKEHYEKALEIKRIIAGKQIRQVYDKPSLYTVRKEVETGIIDFQDETYQNIKSYISSLPKGQQGFAKKNISWLLENDESLEKFHDPNGPLVTYQALHKTGARINSEITDETKKVRDAEAWFEKNVDFFSTLLALDSTLDTGLITGLIKEHLAEGLPKMQGYIEVYNKPLGNQEAVDIIKEALPSFSHPHELGTFLEITNAFFKSDKLELLQEVLADTESQLPLNERASRKLLSIISEDLDIPEEEIEATNLKEWKTEFMPNLVSNDEMMEAKNMNEARKLYRAILRATFRDKFNDFIYDTYQQDRVGQRVARHNKKVKRIFQENGLDHATWANYQNQHDFLISNEVEVDRKSHYIKLLKNRADKVAETLEPFEDKMDGREYDPLMHILQGTNNKKSLGNLEREDLWEKFNNLKERLETLSQKEEYSTDTNWHDVFEHLEHLEEAVELVNRKDHTEVQSREKGFRIKVWDRDPKKDLFQGNYTHCCIAVGVKDVPVEGGFTTHDPSTVMQFLADTGISVVEIYDSEKDNPIGNVWVFVSKNEYGEPILVADNVEIHKDYTGDPHINNTIRENLFDFLTDYAKDVGLAGAGLGLVATNDVAYDDLKNMKVPPVDTISGYLSEYTSSISSRSGRYYLEAFNHQNLGAIHPEKFKKENRPETEQSKNGFIIVSNLDGGTDFYNYEHDLLQEIRAGESNAFSESDLESIQKIEREEFGSIAQSQDDLLQTLQNTRGIQLISREGGKLVGYVSSMPASGFQYGLDHDPDFNPDKDTLYIDSTAGKVDPFETMRLIKEKAREGGYSKLALHGINPRLNKILIHAGFEVKHRVEDWMEAGRQAEYMEMEID